MRHFGEAACHRREAICCIREAVCHMREAARLRRGHLPVARIHRIVVVRLAPPQCIRCRAQHARRERARRPHEARLVGTAAVVVVVIE
eukprot:6754951-Prymnesium_polylepis.1